MRTYITQQEISRVLDYLEREVKRTKERLIAAPEEGSPTDLKLSEATIQDIQLELIRRTDFNLFDGPDVVESLLANRSLWQAVLMTRMSESGLIHLRDLPDNLWNVDTLCILATDERAAHKLAELGESWQADVVNVHTLEATGGTIGDSEPSGPLVTMWWD